MMEAKQRFQTEGFPTKKQEAWKYTPVTHLEKLGFTADAPVAINIEPNQLKALLNESLIDSYSNYFLLTNGLAARHSDIFSELNKPAKPTEEALAYPHHGFTPLNEATATEGFNLRIEKNSIGSDSLYILCLADTDKPQHLPLRHHISLASGARVQLVLHYKSGAKSQHFHNIVHRIHLETGSELTLTTLIEESPSSTHIALTEITQAEASSFSSATALLTGGLVRHDHTVILKESKANCELNGIIKADGKAHLDTHTQVFHRANDTHCKQHYRSVADGEAHVVFNGKIHVQKGTKGCDADMTSKNLLLSTSAEINTKPELEIYADDVICSHGATIGQLDDAELFYLQSRGLEKQAAQKILTRAFLNTVGGLFPDEVSKRHLLNSLGDCHD